MRARESAFLAYLAERHPSLNLQRRTLFSNRGGVRTLEEAQNRVRAAFGCEVHEAYGYDEHQWRWMSFIPLWALPEFFRWGDREMIVPVAHIAEFWFHKLDQASVSSMRKILLDILGESLTRQAFLHHVKERLGEGYAESAVEFLDVCPSSGDQSLLAIAAGKYGAEVGKLVLDGVPLEYAQAVATPK